MRIQDAQVLCGSGFEKKDLFVEQGFFAGESADGEVVDGSGCYAIPGLIDLHLHGCVGYDFSSASAEEMRRMARYQAEQGITAICPTTMTLPEPVLEAACRRVAQCRWEDAARLAGIYLEGPFLSAKKLGAQNPAYLQEPASAVFHRLQQAAGGKIKLLALAPELEGAPELITELGGLVGISLAHTAADYDTAYRAYSLGARQATHLFNGMSPFSHRDPGVVGAAMDSPHCRVELICDGVHIHPSMVRGVFRMFGADRVVLISDSMMAAGMGDGLYELGGLPVAVRGNVARLRDGNSIAGSVTNLMECVRLAVKEMGIPLADAVRAASLNPARALGVDGEYGSIEPGKAADLVLLNADLSLRAVYLGGRRIS